MSSPTFPTIDTWTSGGASRAQATAWLAPLPPKPVEKEFAVSVSPGSGIRGVRVMKSMLREPMTATVLFDAIIVVKGVDVAHGESGWKKVLQGAFLGRRDPQPRVSPRIREERVCDDGE